MRRWLTRLRRVNPMLVDADMLDLAVALNMANAAQVAVEANLSDATKDVGGNAAAAASSDANGAAATAAPPSAAAAPSAAKPKKTDVQSAEDAVAAAALTMATAAAKIAEVEAENQTFRTRKKLLALEAKLNKYTADHVAAQVTLTPNPG